jgi:hypothetical protein
MNIPLIPDWFATTTTAFAGSENSTPETNSLFNDFLQTEEAAPYVIFNPVLSQYALKPETINNQSLKSSYLNFLRSQLQKTYQAESLENLSPKENEQRKVVFTIFDILLTLLKASLTTQMTTGDVMDFFTQKEKSYADLMARVFFYIGTGSISSHVSYGSEYYSTEDWENTNITFSTDPTKYDFGYGHITLDEVAKYCSYYPESTPVVPTTGGTPVVINPNPGTSSLFSFSTSTIWTDSKHHYQLAGNIYLRKALVEGQSLEDAPVLVTFKLSPTNYNTDDPPISDITLSQIVPQDQVKETIENFVYSASNQAKTAGIPLDTHPLMIPWNVGVLASSISSNASDTTMQQYLSKYVQKRGSLNTQLNTCIDTLKSKMNLYSEKRDQVKQVLDSARNARKMTGQIIDACISQMSNIIASVFR